MSKGTRKAFFGTDGVRGVANVGNITPEIALKLGRVAARVMVHGKSTGDAWPRCIIGKDTRISGDLLEAAFAAGMASEGVDVQLAGVVPTPAVSFLVRDEGASVGVVISASHNGYADNGIKFFTGEGYKLSDEEERAMEDLVLADDSELESTKRPTGGKVGRISGLPKAADRYIAMVADSVGQGRSDLLAGVKIALDTANGAAFRTSVAILEKLGADLHVAHAEPNGVNINEGCGCTHPDVLSALVKETGARVGLSHDGDADRILLCDETGDALDGDEIIAIIGVYLLETGALHDNTLVATIMSNCGLDEALRQRGGKVIRSGVGDRQVMRDMRAGDFNFGGEQSGHIICRDYNTTGDGIVAGLQVLRIMVETGKPLSDLRKCLVKFPQLLINIPVTSRPPLEELAEANARIAETEAALGDAGRVLLRYSGTEPKIRLLVEGRDEAFVREHTDIIAGAIKAQIGA
jgi:phosphoglucosamine mutase